jgi:hypothetical protein
MQHKQEEPVRAYLLGTLDNHHAIALEEKYFEDPDFFSTIRNIETELIEDYLQDRLSAGDRRLFEKRYLEVPALARRVEEVREEFANARQTAHRPSPAAWRRSWAVVSLAGVTLSLVLAGGVVFWRAKQHSMAAAVGLPRIARELPVITVRLTPGLLKGPSARSLAVTPHSSGAMVRLLLELPGRSSPGDYHAQLMAIGTDGQRNRIWTSGTLASESAPGGSVLTVDLGAGLIAPGDYVVEVRSLKNEVLDTYFLRMNAVP